MVTLTAIEQQLNPFPVYKEMRKNQAVYLNPEWGSWNIFRYDDVFRALSDYNTFSSQFSGGRMGVDQPFAYSMISTDPPRHRQLRNLVTQAFTPRAVEALAPRITTIVNDLLDKAGRTGKMDVIHDLGTPLPVTVIAELLGIPSQDRDQFKKWSDMVVTLSNQTNGSFDFGAGHFDSAIMEMVSYFLSMIETRRLNPGSDLISGLLEANIEGEHLQLPELMGFCVLLLVAGNETTTNLLGNAILTFLENPGSWQRLRENPDPDLLNSAIEEVLRFRSPVQSMFRITKTDVELSGRTIPAGSHCVVWIGSANHDEDQFPDADSFVIDRSPNKHLAFGQGIHYCLGAPLARLEARIALRGMLERFSAIEAVPNVSYERLPSLIVYGIRSLPITML